jgi:molybdopterin/thiamine biosynthesis adenylyltransferase
MNTQDGGSRAAGGSEGGLDVQEYSAAALSRNGGLIDPQEQAALRASTILVAGCGSVGGSAVDPLVRLGAMRFRFADPDVFELSNLNRQVCVLDDIGRPKGEVLADRVLAINPFAEVKVYNEGLTLENVDEALAGVGVVFDGIDPEQSAWVKYSLHERSAARGIPVMAGYDFGGKPTLYVFDYRRDRRPFFGKATAEAHREERYRDALRWLGYFHFPADFLPIMRAGLRHGGVWPQVSYCVQGLGALASRTAVDLLMARDVRRVVSMDIHRVAKPYPRALASMARIPSQMLRTLVVANRYAKAHRPSREGPAADPRAANADLDIPRPLVTVLEAARSAPSHYNAQPWAFRIVADDRITVDWNTERLLGPLDPERRLDTYALGCAVEAMAQVTQCQWSDADGDDGRGVGELRFERLEEATLLTRQGVLGARATNRGDYLLDGLDLNVLRAAEAAAGELGVTLHAIDGRAGIDRLAGAVATAARSKLGADSEAIELRRWIRRRRAGDSGLTGIDLGPLLGPLAARTWSGRLLRTPLAAALTARAARSLRHSAALLLLESRDDSTAGRLRAGRALMRAWLVLTEAGYAVAPEQSTLESAAATAATREAAGIKDDGTLVTMLRVGRPLTPAQPSPRLPLTELVSVERPAARDSNPIQGSP